MSLKVVAHRLSELLDMPVKMAKDVIGEDAHSIASGLQPGEIMLLENLRFHPEEEANDSDFAKKLASFADIYVSDSFGTVHRAHASTEGVSKYLPSVSGFLLNRELELLGGALEHPARPFVAILGGSKVSDKIGVIKSLIDKADTILLGGGMAYTFLKAKGHNIGKSICELDELTYASDMLRKAEEHGVKFMLPCDHVTAAEYDKNAVPSVTEGIEIPDEMMGLDIGPKTVEEYTAVIKEAATVIWNGPMGVFEFEHFATGTREIARAMAHSDAVTIIGGGDSAAAARQLGFADGITLISTGGGASLEFVEGIELPGVKCLADK